MQKISRPLVKLARLENIDYQSKDNLASMDHLLNLSSYLFECHRMAKKFRSDKFDQLKLPKLMDRRKARQLWRHM